MDNLRIDIAVNGVKADETKMITVLLENVLTYNKIIFQGLLNMDTKTPSFERLESNILTVESKDNTEGYNVQFIFDLIEKTMPLWYDILASKEDGYQGPEIPFFVEDSAEE